ncbi:MAG: serine hydrolase [Verrucomicrobiota bacterium]
MVSAISLFGCLSATGLEPSAVEAAYQYSKSHGGIGMIIHEQGDVRFERYASGHSGNKAIHIYSGTKSLFGLAAVIAEAEGILLLSERVADTIPEWRNDPRKREITIRELLNFTSGLETGFQQIYGRTSADKLKLSLGLETSYPRGSSFVYGPSHLQVFCEVLQRKLAPRGITYEDYVKRKILMPLGIKVSRWNADAHGNVIPSAGLYLTAKDWLKFGEMVAQGGRYRHKRIVRTEVLSRCFVGTHINPAYGLTFWLNSYAPRPDSREVDVEEWLSFDTLPTDWRGACLSKRAPSDLICCLGSNFQRLYIVPSQQLVVLHQGKKGTFRDAEFLALLFEGLPVSEIPIAKPVEPDSGFPGVFNGWRRKGKKR